MERMLIDMPTPTPTLSDDLLSRMDRSGPRYTSYPTADRFVEAFTERDLQQALSQRQLGAVGGAGGPLSVYVHLPFCESVCYYCACNKVVTRDHDRSAPYIDAVLHELDLVCDVMGRGVHTTQLHFGGGTPTFLSDAELDRLMQGLRARLKFAERGEYSIEIDPRTVTRDRLQHLRELGFNRVSFGVQDFDEAVQRAVHRLQPFEQVQALMSDARELGFDSINVDLIYGLPLQTTESFSRTVRQVAGLRPDRIALYGYAHLPQRFKPQRRIVNEQLPSGGQRIGMLSQAISGFISHGYQYIGMDHFALPDDPLAQAKRQGRLHRNFQGYSTQPDCDLVALGVSAISRIGVTYSQNAKTLDEYYDGLRRGLLPVVRGLVLSRDDLVRRAVIMSIMCHGRLSYESVSLAHLIDVHTYFRHELEALAGLEADGLLIRDNDGFELTALGWYFVRAVAMVFDRYATTDQARERFSKVI
ncbi:oxygen-independent coproporphyrinogen-3 oxidase [Sphaerotilus hippei]|uniref:Coproporphyrinogen-III oxidase n=1 Tax=Sphaerotilus hippei TaxID=744406 RepID=A0A318H5L2_9BURK|nr:oxygen-independent coproporphyrinogen III oxidase [Sphaerotilus hippei]PXW98737.1 oxygen-independent coproporphyrinogen-3 oxidase [Sphaerotilus hippei]